MTTAEGRSELDFANVLRESLASAVIIVDARRLIAGFNPLAEKLLHLKTERVLGKSIELLPVPLRRFIEEAFASGQGGERQIVLPSQRDKR